MNIKKLLGGLLIYRAGQAGRRDEARRSYPIRNAGLAGSLPWIVIGAALAVILIAATR